MKIKNLVLYEVYDSSCSCYSRFQRCDVGRIADRYDTIIMVYENCSRQPPEVPVKRLACFGIQIGLAPTTGKGSLDELYVDGALLHDNQIGGWHSHCCCCHKWQ